MSKHGQYHTRAYSSWDAMTQRCTNPKHSSYGNYGGRGIRICDAWRQFENFVADMGQPPSPKHSLDRIDSNGDYCADNCRWATPKEQANNTRKNRWLTLNGVTRTVSQWAEEIGCRSALIDQRLRRGWPIQRVLSGVVQEHKVGRRFEFRGMSLTLGELAKYANVPYKRLHKRIVAKGWDVERAVLEPGK